MIVYMSEIQAILFDKNNWTTTSSKAWINSHGYKPIKEVHITNNNYRYRLRNPKECHRMRIQHVGHGISFIYCF
jgi:hypothetical protein